MLIVRSPPLKCPSCLIFNVSVITGHGEAFWLWMGVTPLFKEWGGFSYDVKEKGGGGVKPPFKRCRFIRKKGHVLCPIASYILWWVLFKKRVYKAKKTL